MPVARRLTLLPPTPTSTQNRAPEGGRPKYQPNGVSPGKTTHPSRPEPVARISVLRSAAFPPTATWRPIRHDPTRNPTFPARTRTVGVDRCVHPSATRRHAARPKRILLVRARGVNPAKLSRRPPRPGLAAKRRRMSALGEGEVAWTPRVPPAYTSPALKGASERGTTPPLIAANTVQRGARPWRAEPSLARLLSRPHRTKHRLENRLTPRQGQETVAPSASWG